MPKLSEVAHLGKAVTDALSRDAPDIELGTLPESLDLSGDALTDNVIAINANTPNTRQKQVNEALVRHLHSFVREVHLTTDEWMAAIEFLTKTGQTCTDIRQEFILLSDVFGVSALVDVLNHPKPKGATESTVLGPFFVEEAPTIAIGGSIASEGKGEYMLVRGQVRDMKGNPVPNCLIETWETDEDGYYDTQYSDFKQDCRGRLFTDEKGQYAFRGVLPVAYPIPNDASLSLGNHGFKLTEKGPVGKLLRSMNRHVFRPAHLHLMFRCHGFEDLITALYFQGDTFLTSDAVFGVKSSLVEDTVVIRDDAEARKYGFKHAPFHLVERDFVLLTKVEAEMELHRSRQGTGL